MRYPVLRSILTSLIVIIMLFSIACVNSLLNSPSTSEFFLGMFGFVCLMGFSVKSLFYIWGFK